MSENTEQEQVTIVGSVDGPRKHIVTALERGRKISQTNLVEDLMNAGQVRDDEGRIFSIPDMTGWDADSVFGLVKDYADALFALLEEGSVHSAKGKGGGLKLGEKKPPTLKSLMAAALQANRKAKQGQ